MAKKTKIAAKAPQATGKVMISKENHRKPQEGEAVELRGMLRKLRKNRHGEVDGMILADGSMIRFPVEIGGQVKGRIHRDDDVMIIGVYHESSKGDLQVIASYLECLKSALTIDIETDIKTVIDIENRVRGLSADADSGNADSTSESTPHDSSVLQELARLHSRLESQLLKDAAERKLQHEAVLKELSEIRIAASIPVRHATLTVVVHS
jgi:hypothetical protein